MVCLLFRQYSHRPVWMAAVGYHDSMEPRARRTVLSFVAADRTSVQLSPGIEVEYRMYDDGARGQSARSFRGRLPGNLCIYLLSAGCTCRRCHCGRAVSL